MKKILLSLTLFFLAVPFVLAQEKNGDVSPSPTKGVTDKIQEIKEKVASRVEALKKEKLGGLSGTLKSTSEGALILISDNLEYSVQLDEDAKIYSIDQSLRKKEVKLTDIEKNKHLVIIGEINKEEKSAIAKVVVEKEPNLAIFGQVSDVSTKDGTITVTSNEGKTYTVDIEVSTKSNLYDPFKDTLTKIGLSKIEKGLRVHVYGITGKEENRVTALRVLILPKEIKPKEKASPTPEATLTPTETTQKPTPTSTKTPTKTPTPTKTE